MNGSLTGRNHKGPLHAGIECMMQLFETLARTVDWKWHTVPVA